MKIVTVMLTMLLFFAMACEKGAPSFKNETPEDPQALRPPPHVIGGTLPLPAEGPGQVAVATLGVHSHDSVHYLAVEIASSDEQRAKGLMGRESLNTNNGMWFVYPRDVQDSFWMKDTSIPLDIIFVGSDMKVVDIIARTTPQSTEPLSPKALYRYVLEVNAGYAEAKGIAIGDTVELRIGPQAPE